MIGVSNEEIDIIRRQLQEAPPGLFRPTLVPVLNSLFGVYSDWIESDSGKQFCNTVVGMTLSLPRSNKGATMEGYLPTTEDYLSGW